jgi:hypothetical protein
MKSRNAPYYEGEITNCDPSVLAIHSGKRDHCVFVFAFLWAHPYNLAKFAVVMHLVSDFGTDVK